MPIRFVPIVTMAGLKKLLQLTVLRLKKVRLRAAVFMHVVIIV